MASSDLKDSIQAHEEKNIIVENDKVIIKPLALDIVWGKDRKYWSIDQRFAELKQVCWLEVKGSVEMRHLQPNTKYKLEFRVQMKPEASGWDNNPVYIMVKPGRGTNCIWARIDLSRIKKGEQQSSSIPSRVEFTAPSSVVDDKVAFGLFEIWKMNWKGGLAIEEVVISKVIDVK